MYALTGKVFKGWSLVASEWMLVALIMVLLTYSLDCEGRIEGDTGFKGLLKEGE
jgi:hypothetical protein